MPVVEQRGEQRGRRRHAAGLLGQRQRGVLVGQQPGQLGLHRRHRAGHAARPISHPDRQGVDERARAPGPRRPGVHPAEQHRAEHHVLAARHRRQHPRPGQVEQRRRGYPQPPGPLPHPRRQASLHRQPRPAAPRSRHRGRPAARTARSARSRPPAARRSTARAPPAAPRAGPAPRSHGTAAAPAAGPPPRPAAPAPRPAPPPARCGPAPGGGPAPAPATGRCPARRPHATRSSGARPRSIHDPAAASSSVHRVRPGRRPGHLGHRQRGLPPHHLHRLGQPLPRHRRPVDVMPVHHPLQRGRELLQPLPRGEPQHTAARTRLRRTVGAPVVPAIRWWKNIPSCSGASG